MQDKKSIKNIWERLLHKYRFVIMTDDSFEEKLSVKVSRMRLFVFCFLLIVFCSVFTTALITYTPLKKFIPGKSSVEVQKNLIELTIKSDSLEAILNSREAYLENINRIIRGEDINNTGAKSTANEAKGDISFKKSKEDSVLRLVVENEENGSIVIEKNTKNEFLVFFTPLKGIITSEYNIKEKHFGVDVVSKDKSRISSTLDGSVIISHWTPKTGNVIAIQHEGEFISLYKHNSVLLKKPGDFVRAGEHVAIIGNSGEYSTGPHLHFELWHKGRPVNPENFISF